MRCCFVTKRERAEKIRNSSPDFSPCPSVLYPLGGSKSLTVSGKLRELMYEVLFEEDLDHLCISTMILNVIASVDVESRTLLAENIVLIGGTCMAPGFKARLKVELLRQLKNERYKKFKNIKMIKFHSPPAKENYTAWLGGKIVFWIDYFCGYIFIFVAALYGATEIVSMKALTKDQYFKENRLPDWSNLKDVIRTV